MSLIIIGYSLITLGMIAIFLAIIGLFRFPDFFTKIHVSGLIESCGIPLSLIGLAFLQNDVTNSLKLIFAFLIIMLLNPVSTHSIARAALLMKVRIYNGKKND